MRALRGSRTRGRAHNRLTGRPTATACFIDAMNTVIVDPQVVVAAPSPARPPVLVTSPRASICHRATLLRSALPFRTRIAMTATARTDG